MTTTAVTETVKSPEMAFTFKVLHVQIPGVQQKISIQGKEVEQTTMFKIMNVDFNGLKGDLTPLLPADKKHGEIDTCLGGNIKMFAVALKTGDLYSLFAEPTAIDWKKLKVDTEASPFGGSIVVLTLKTDAMLWVGNKEQSLIIKAGQRVTVTMSM
jgi:hypothetical protein